MGHDFDSLTDRWDAYLADEGALQQRDADIRLSVLEAFAKVESELIAVGVFYLGGASMARQEAVEQCIGRWGGFKLTLDLMRVALPLHGVGDDVPEKLADIQALRELRNLIAHGRVTTWQANDPDVEDGRAGRQILNRTGKGVQSWKRIDFDDAEEKVTAALAAVDFLSRTLAEVTRGTVGTHDLTYGPDGPKPV